VLRILTACSSEADGDSIDGRACATMSSMRRCSYQMSASLNACSYLAS